jgi:MFS family permease
MLNLFSSSTRSVTAWIGSLQAALVFTLAIIGGSMFDKYGPRPLMIFGTITSVAGYLALSWVSVRFDLTWFSLPRC